MPSFGYICMTTNFSCPIFLIPYYFPIGKLDIIPQEAWQVSTLLPIFFSSFDPFFTLAAANRTRTSNQIVLKIKLLHTPSNMKPLLFYDYINLLILKHTVLLQHMKSNQPQEVENYLIQQIHLFIQFSLQEDNLYLIDLEKTVFPFIRDKVELTLIIKKMKTSMIQNFQAILMPLNLEDVLLPLD